MDDPRYACLHYLCGPYGLVMRASAAARMRPKDLSVSVTIPQPQDLESKSGSEGPHYAVRWKNHIFNAFCSHYPNPLPPIVQQPALDRCVATFCGVAVFVPNCGLDHYIQNVRMMEMALALRNGKIT